ncbi:MULTISPECIES: DUF6378 domain-containing protein [unclassified Nitratiruptor]|uniref:DUF6378 domain-containing protein n=1 Tax=unclassified Nitratiruptor TaxID=2624044 RepID=UPI0019157E30|nr:MULTISPECIES: DUF6378 domain-containing protein [unclassified Nitratiruptor]BCD59597.1 phage-related protein [Nitratiruptor sp. YY08-10]BCD63521.1 phage-related protein [Nitratiruptor sp. YY08-14]BCD83073.1 phage-related protein [Nitratiruptor phage NrS-2]BCD83139.1 hypothetical protein NrS3_23 [Nitratiruptor phage NrS-3]
MIEQILQERQKTHGDFKEQAEISQILKDQIALTEGYKRMLNSTQREALQMIAHKIARILAGDPNEVDHWRDIAGYATLVVKELEK